MSKVFLILAPAFAEIEGQRFVQRARDRVAFLRNTDRWGYGLPPFGFQIVDHPSGLPTTQKPRYQVRRGRPGRPGRVVPSPSAQAQPADHRAGGAATTAFSKRLVKPVGWRCQPEGELDFSKATRGSNPLSRGTSVAVLYGSEAHTDWGRPCHTARSQISTAS